MKTISFASNHAIFIAIAIAALAFALLSSPSLSSIFNYASAQNTGFPNPNQKTNTTGNKSPLTGPPNLNAKSTTNDTKMITIAGPNKTTPLKVNQVKPSNRTLGLVGSLQNEGGKPTWVVVGQWRMELAKPLSQAGPNPDAKNFNTRLTMAMLNGSGIHRHTITGYNQTSSTHDPKTNSTEFKGTVTVNLKDGLHRGVPISIKILNDTVVAISLDGPKTNNHFGNTPIFGTVLRPLSIPITMSPTQQPLIKGNSSVTITPPNLPR